MNEYLIPINWLRTIIEDVFALILSIIITVIGLLTPIKNIVNLLLLLFFIDVVFGYLAAHKLRGECFKVSIIWKKTMPKMLVATALIVLTYLWDITYGQDFVSSYKLIGWFISGLLIVSIAENGWKITQWRPFLSISSIIKGKIETTTNEKIGE
jgi:hypothetical protein